MFVFAGEGGHRLYVLLILRSSIILSFHFVFATTDAIVLWDVQDWVFVYR